MITIVSLLVGLAFGETFDVYVSPMKFVDQTTSGRVSLNHDRQAPFYYTSNYARLAKASNGRGGYHSIKNNYDDIRVYNHDTIKFIHDDCSYLFGPLECSVKNGHYYVETIVTFNDDQMVVRTTLYDKDATVINTSSRTDEMQVNWIRQQEITVIESEGRGGKQKLTHYGKEELPLKWEIPYQLLQNHVQQAVMGLWLGIKID
jgi:hypothetical protein